MPDGQHEAGKHSKAGKKRAAAQPRMPKSKAKAAVPKGSTYGKPAKGVLRKILGL